MKGVTLELERNLHFGGQSPARAAQAGLRNQGSCPTFTLTPEGSR